MLFTYALCIQGKHHLLTYVDKEHKVIIYHLQSGGMSMALLHKHVTLAEDP